MDKPRKTLKLMPEYQCFCLWLINEEDFYDNIDPNQLPISQELKRDLTTWEEKHAVTLDWDDPKSSSFQSEQEEKQFVKDGYNLQKRLQQELGDEYIVNLSL